MPRLLTFWAIMLAVAASLGLATPCAAQDSVKDWADAFDKETRAKTTLYLAKHPVRSSPLFEAAGQLIAVLGAFDALIIEACEYEPDFPEWQDAAEGLRENTILELGNRYEEGMQKRFGDTPDEEVVRDRSLCADEKRHRVKIAHELEHTFMALRRQGY